MIGRRQQQCGRPGPVPASRHASACGAGLGQGRIPNARRSLRIARVPVIGETTIADRWDRLPIVSPTVALCSRPDARSARPLIDRGRRRGAKRRRRPRHPHGGRQKAGQARVHRCPKVLVLNGHLLGVARACSRETHRTRRAAGVSRVCMPARSRARVHHSCDTNRGLSHAWGAGDDVDPPPMLTTFLKRLPRPCPQPRKGACELLELGGTND